MDQLAIDEKRVNHNDLFNTFNALTGNIRISVNPKADSDINTAKKFVHSVKDTQISVKLSIVKAFHPKMSLVALQKKTGSLTVLIDQHCME